MMYNQEQKKWSIHHKIEWFTDHDKSTAIILPTLISTFISILFSPPNLESVQQLFLLYPSLLLQSNAKDRLLLPIKPYRCLENLCDTLHTLSKQLRQPEASNPRCRP